MKFSCSSKELRDVLFMVEKAIPKQRKVRVPGEYRGGKKTGRFGQLYKDTFGKLLKPFGAE